MTTLDPGGAHVDGRDMLIAELEDRLTAAQGEIRRLLALVEEHRDRAEAAHNLHANAERLLAEAKRRECTALCRDVEEDRDRLLPVVEAAKALRLEMERVGWEEVHVSVAAGFVLAVDALGTDAADGAGTGEQDVAQVRHRIDDLLCTAQRHLGNATDPDTPDTHFRCHLTIGARSAQAAYGLIELAKVLSPADCVAVAAGMAELLVDGEVLVSWLDEELNREPAASLAGSSTATATVCDGCQKPVTGCPCGRGFCCEECRSECVNSTAVRDAS